MTCVSAEWYQYYKENLVRGHFRKYSSGDYADRNCRLVEMIKGYNFKTVVEVAGAEADMAEKMLKEFPCITLYSWSDLVSEAIDNANKRITHSRFKTDQLDLDTESPPSADLFISTALEHTLKYREIIEELEPNTLVLISLPNFDSIGHRTFFPQFTDVINVYSELLDFIKAEVFISECVVVDEFFIFVKKCLNSIGLLNFFRRFGVFKKGYGRDSIKYKWLILARRKRWRIRIK